MRRAVLLFLSLSLLAACGGGDQPGAAAASSTPGAAATTTAPKTVTPLAAVDQSACDTVVARADNVHQWAADIAGGGADGAQYSKAHLDVLTLSSTASTYVGQVQSSDLDQALSDVQAAAAKVKAQGSAAQTGPLRDALEAAAAACEQGGDIIAWRHG